MDANVKGLNSMWRNAKSRQRFEKYTISNARIEPLSARQITECNRHRIYQGPRRGYYAGLRYCMCEVFRRRAMCCCAARHPHDLVARLVAPCGRPAWLNSIPEFSKKTIAHSDRIEPLKLIVCG